MFDGGSQKVRKGGKSVEEERDIRARFVVGREVDSVEQEDVVAAARDGFKVLLGIGQGPSTPVLLTVFEGFYENLAVASLAFF
jgi:hypothetical protein